MVDEKGILSGNFLIIGISSIIVIIFFSTVLSSCESTIPGLSGAERKMADSLYRNKMKEFRPAMDSICKAYQDSLKPILVDSMKKARIIEIERQLERIKKLK